MLKRWIVFAAFVASATVALPDVKIIPLPGGNSGGGVTLTTLSNLNFCILGRYDPIPTGCNAIMTVTNDSYAGSLSSNANYNMVCISPTAGTNFYLCAGAAGGGSSTNNEPVINVVTDFGADNTGATYTRASIQRALDFAISLSPTSPPVFFPAGTYNLTTNAVGGYSILQITNTTDLIVRSSPFEAALSNSSLSGANNLLLLKNVNRITIDGPYFQGPPSMTHTTAANNAISIQGNSDNITFLRMRQRGFYFGVNAGSDPSVDHVSDLKFFWCKFSEIGLFDDGYPITLSGVARAIGMYNVFTNTMNYAIGTYSLTNQLAANSSRDQNFSFNIFQDCRGIGWQTYGDGLVLITNLTAIGNSFDNFTKAGAVSDTSNSNSRTGNTLGLSFANVSGLNVWGNTFRSSVASNTSANSMIVTNCQGLITGNSFKNGMTISFLGSTASLNVLANVGQLDILTVSGTTAFTNLFANGSITAVGVLTSGGTLTIGGRTILSQMTITTSTNFTSGLVTNSLLNFNLDSGSQSNSWLTTGFGGVGALAIVYSTGSVNSVQFDCGGKWESTGTRYLTVNAPFDGMILQTKATGTPFFKWIGGNQFFRGLYASTINAPTNTAAKTYTNFTLAFAGGTQSITWPGQRGRLYAECTITSVVAGAGGVWLSNTTTGLKFVIPAANIAEVDDASGVLDASAGDTIIVTNAVTGATSGANILSLQGILE